jgi:uncharacterized membrane protein YccC
MSRIVPSLSGYFLMGPIRARQVVFALNCYCAVMLALYVAFSLDLPNPWWAMVTVFLGQPPQPLVGAIWAKAFYRTLGTAVGLIASLVMIPSLSDAPELMILALATWVALCLYLSLLDRTPRGYVFMLAGYTVALVGLPAATDPTRIFDSAVARSEEIVIGVLAIAVVHSIFLPRSVTAAVHAKLDAILNDARNWIVDGLRSSTVAPSSPISRRIAIDLTELNLLATNLKFEGEFASAGGRILRALEDRFATLLPLTSAIEDRLKALSASGDQPPGLGALMERLCVWVAAAHQPGSETAHDLARDIQELAPPLHPECTWADLLLTSLTDRLAELVESWNASLTLTAAMRDPSKQSITAARTLLGAGRPRSLHVDRGIAALSGLVAAACIIGLAIFTVATRWESGPLAIGITAVLCSLFAASDDPTPMARTLTVWFVVAFPLAVLYEFGILPAIDGFVSLGAVLFPILVTIGFFFGQPQHALKALAVAVGFSAALALQPTFIDSFPAFMNAYVGLVIGSVFGVVGLQLARGLPVQSVIRRILRAGWKDLALLTATSLLPERSVWASRMLDRVALLLPRLARAPIDQEGELIDALNDLRLGVGIIDLRRLHADPDHIAEREIKHILHTLGAYFRRRASGQRTALPESVVAALDALIGAILHMSAPVDRHSGVVAAIGLRRSLFPGAPAYQPPASAT